MVSAAGYSKPPAALSLNLTTDALLKINNFDLIRIFAATQVLIFHSAAHLKIDLPLTISWLACFPGVPIFFVTSGFLISASYERSSSLWTYARNRIRRIYPALWVCLAITAIVVSGFGYQVWSKQGLLWLGSQLIGAIYTPTFLQTFGFGSYNGSLWTIPIELQFYALTPVVFFFARKTGRQEWFLSGTLVAFTAVAVGLGYLAPTVMGFSTDAETALEKLLRYSFAPQFFVFMAGVVARRLGLWNHPLFRGKVLAWIILVILYRQVVPRSVLGDVGFELLLASCTISAAYSLLGARNALKGNDISYGVYVYHGLLLNILVQLGLVGKIAYLFVVWFGAYAAGLISWNLVEKPLLGKGRGRLSRTHFVAEQARPETNLRDPVPAAALARTRPTQP